VQYNLKFQELKSFIKILLLIVILTTVISCNIHHQKDKLSDVSKVEITLPYNFKSDQAEKLSISAFNLRQKGYYDQAILLYNRAVTIEPDNPKLFFDLSECYARKDEMQEAILCLDTCISLDSSYSSFYGNRGLYYYKAHQDEKAMIDLKKAITLNDSNYVYYTNLSLVYYATDNLDKACDALNHAKALGLPEEDLRNQKELNNLEQDCK